MTDVRFGDRVVCTGYAKRSGHAYEILSEKETPDGRPACFLSGRVDDSERVEVEDFHSCDRFVVKETKEFEGIFVGYTTICTRLNVELEDDSYRGLFFRTYCDQPKPFGVVYYAPNKKRLVPPEMMKVKGENR